MTIKEVAEVLKSAERLGTLSMRDEPEGVRYIILSETLVDKLVAALEVDTTMPMAVDAK